MVAAASPSVLGALQGKRALATLARDNPAMFAGFVLKDERTNAPIKLAPMHRAWHDLVSRHDRLLCWSHVESGKSSQIAIARTLWEVCRDPSKRALILSNTHGQATKITRAIAQYIESSSELHEVFPKAVPGTLWTQSALTLRRAVRSKDPTIQATGMGGHILGSRLDFVVVDDILDFTNTLTQDARQKTWDWFNANVLGRLTLGAKVVVIGNAHHHDDLMHRFAKMGWTAVRYPVLDDLNNERWPERWPRARIEAARVGPEALLPVEFARQLMCVARDDASSKFKEAWIEQAKARGEGKQVATWMARIPPGYRTFTGIDLAISRSDAADLTALTTLIIHPDGTREILCVESGRWSGIDVVQRAFDAHRRFQSIVIVENNAAQDLIVQWAANRYAFPIKGFTTGRNKAHPEFGVEAIAAEMGVGKWIIPNEGGRMHPEVEALVQEMRNFDPRAHTGDRLMACVVSGALVTTRRGLVPIEQVVAGDYVLTHKARFRLVTGVTSRAYDGDVVALKPSGLGEVLLTPEHPVWVADTKVDYAGRTNRQTPGEWAFVFAGELRAAAGKDSMFILAPKWGGRPCLAPPRIDMAAFIGVRSLAWGGRWHVNASTLRWRQEAEYPRFLDVDERAAMLLGLYMAEGSVGGKNGGHQASFAFHARETYLAEFVSAEAHRLFGARSFVYKREGHGGMEVHVSSVLAARLLKQFGKRAGKALPWDWMAWPLALRLAVVRGWMLGDGNMRLRKNGGCYLRAVTVARQWLAQVQMTFWEAEMTPAVSPFAQSATFRGKPCGHLPAWQLVLTEQDSERLLRTPLDIERAHWHGRWPKEKEHTNVRAVAHENGAAYRIASTERERYIGNVHNLHVEEDESFVVAGIAVHNCWFAKEGARMTMVKSETGWLDLRP